MDREDPPSIREAFLDGYTLTGLFGRPACSHPSYVRTARIIATINLAVLLGGAVYLVVERHPIAAGALVLWGLGASLAARR